MNNAKRRITVHIGTVQASTCHSYRDFPTYREAETFMWACIAMSPPQVACMWNPADGWINNSAWDKDKIPASIALDASIWVAADAACQADHAAIDKAIDDARKAQADAELLARCQQLDDCYTEAAASDAANGDGTKVDEEAEYYRDLERGYAQDRI